MSGYTKYLKDPSETPEHIASSKDCFDMEKFRFHKEAKKKTSFLYKLTETSHFSFYIECRALGRSDHDAQIMYFEKVMNKARTLKQPKLLDCFVEEKSIKTM